VVCSHGLEDLPADDLPWILDEIAGYARHFVFIAVTDTAGSLRARNSRNMGTVHRAEWWAALLDDAARRRPHLHWSLMVASGADFDNGPVDYRLGGRFLGEQPPSVWVLEDHKPGHTTQSLGLVEALGWPYRQIKLEFSAKATRPNFLRGATLRGLTQDCVAELVGPWPDLVVAAGSRSAPVAEWIRQQSKGRTRTVFLGRKGAHVGNRFDLAVAPSYVGLYPDPRRIETTVPLTRVSGPELDRAAARWHGLSDGGAVPRIALLVGGDDAAHELSVAQARTMGREVAAMAHEAGGSVYATTSRRTSPEAARALVDALGDVVAHCHHWSPEQKPEENPYMGYLAIADMLVVTGESASMLAEACATGKPVFIYPLAKRARGTRALKYKIAQGLAQRIMQRALARPLNRRGWERPQSRLELLCARLVARGWVRPQRDIAELHETLVDRGQARYFNGEGSAATHEPLNEAAEVAEQVRRVLGVDQISTQASTNH
jgi:mitochondrial fission protein ELM1